MKLLQWNIWYKEDIHNIAKTIKEIDPDIVCLQELAEGFEVNKELSTEDYLREELQMNRYVKETQTWATYNKTSQSNGIYSKFPIIEENFQYLREPVFDTKDWSKEGRAYIEATLQIGNKKLTVGTTHLSYIHAFEMTEEKKVEVDKLIDILKNKSTNYIFTADLNSQPKSYTVEEISKYLTNAGPDYSQNSWTTKPFDDSQGFVEIDLNWRLDYVFHTNDIKVISSKIIQTSFSDHLPILVEFEL